MRRMLPTTSPTTGLIWARAMDKLSDMGKSLKKFQALT